MNNKILKTGIAIIIPVTLSVGLFMQDKKITNLKTEISKTNIPQKEKLNKVMSNQEVKMYQKDIEKQFNNFLENGILPKNKKASDFMLKVFGLRVDNNVSQSQFKKYMSNFSYRVESCFGKIDDNNSKEVNMILKISIKQGKDKIETVAPYIKVTLDAQNGEILNGTFYQAESDGEQNE